MKIRTTAAVLCTIYYLAGAGSASAQQQGASATVPAATVSATTAGSELSAAAPPMGWNSYNCYGSSVHEDEVKANADYIARHLKYLGWQYVVVDFLWAYDNLGRGLPYGGLPALQRRSKVIERPIPVTVPRV